MNYIKFMYVFVLSWVCTAIPFVAAYEIELEITDPTQTTVENLVVYLTPIKNKQVLPKNSTPVVITQENTKFAPYVTVVQKGQMLSFHNKDDITHHIYSVSGDNRFEFKVKAGDEKSSPMLDHMGEIAMGCNIHDWMSGYVLVVDTPYYSLTNTDGLVKFDLITGGEYQVVIWHPELDTPNYQIQQNIKVDTTSQTNNKWNIQLPKVLLPLPEQESQDEFDFLEEY